jgi:hypothetical protein
MAQTQQVSLLSLSSERDNGQTLTVVTISKNVEVLSWRPERIIRIPIQNYTDFAHLQGINCPKHSANRLRFRNGITAHL